MFPDYTSRIHLFCAKGKNNALFAELYEWAVDVCVCYDCSASGIPAKILNS